MRLKRYGIVLESLTRDHLEMVRLWRNQDHVRKHMHFTRKLSREDQQKWFDALDAEHNLYWVIRSNDYPVGLIHVKYISENYEMGEAGIFIGEPSYLHMPQPMLAILVMMEIAFKAVGIKQLKAKIKRGNSRAIAFNSKLGYQVALDQTGEFQYYYVDEEAFDQATEKLRKSAQHMYGTETVVEQLTQLNDLGSKLVSGLATNDEQFRPKFI